MRRIRLVIAGLIIMTGFSGCGIFQHDKPCFPRLKALFCGNSTDSTAGYPEMQGDCASCNGAIPVGGGPMMNGPVIMNPPINGNTIAPPLNPNPVEGKIPPAKIKESEGKQFELEGASKTTTGPVLAVPAGVLKAR